MPIDGSPLARVRTKILRRTVCRWFGHAWHIADVGPECSRCGVPFDTADGRARATDPVTSELRITSVDRIERLAHEELVRLGRLLRRPAGQTQRVMFRHSAHGTVELRVPGYPGLLPAAVAAEVVEVLGPFEQAMEAGRPRTG